MRLRAGAKYYQNRIDNDQPVVVKHLVTGDHGVVTRVTPKGNHIPPQAYVVFGHEEGAPFNELWCPLKELEHA